MPITYTPEPIEETVKDIAPVEIQMVRQTSLEPLWDELIRRYHYLGHRKTADEKKTIEITKLSTLEGLTACT